MNIKYNYTVSHLEGNDHVLKEIYFNDRTLFGQCD